MEETLYHLHFKQEESHWWFAARSEIIRHVIDRGGYLKPGETILDIGCGTGAIMRALADRYTMVGIDMSPLAVEYTRKRGLGDVYLMPVQEFPKEKYDVRGAVLLDVIEHIDDDIDVLRTARDIVGPEGHIIITVPAYMWLWSAHDLANHHKRRYDARTLRAALDKAGLEPVKLTYYNTLLFPLAVIKKMIDRNKTAEQAASEVDQPPGWMNSLFKAVFRLEKYLLTWLRLPYGVSLMTIARPKRK